MAQCKEIRTNNISGTECHFKYNIQKSSTHKRVTNRKIGP